MPYKYEKCLQPVYAGKFQCNGRACGSMCCKGWEVVIDGAAYEKYANIENSDRVKLLSNIKWNDDAGNFKVKFPKDGRCPFLREDMLCFIQRKYGGEFLSDVCAIYPRQPHGVQGVMLRGLGMTCPVAARTALSEKEPMSFELIELKDDRIKVVRSIDSKSHGEDVIKNFFVIQTGCITILQNRALTIDRRLIAMGRALFETEEFFKSGRADMIAGVFAPDKIAEYGRQFQSESKVLGSFIKYIPDLIEELKYNRVKNEKGIADSHFEMAGKIFRLESEAVPHYESAREKAETILKNFDYVIENYLINDFFVRLFPFAFNGTITHNYFMFLIFYKTLEFFLTALSDSMTELSEEDIIGFISRFDLTTRSAGIFNELSEKVAYQFENNREFFINAMQSA